MVKKLCGFFVLTLPLMTQTAFAADLKRGEELLNDNCFGCHGTHVYVRENRIVNSYDELLKRVKFCETQIGLTWFDDEIEDVAAYLNSEYYRFKQN